MPVGSSYIDVSEYQAPRGENEYAIERITWSYTSINSDVITPNGEID